VTLSVRARGENAALLVLAQGGSAEDAARAAGVSSRTIHRWAADPDFAARVAELRAELLARTVGALVDASLDAVRTLRECLKARSEATRVRAATALLHALVVVRESVDLEQRIAALEAADRDREGDR